MRDHVEIQIKTITIDSENTQVQFSTFMLTVAPSKLLFLVTIYEANISEFLTNLFKARQEFPYSSIHIK